MSKPQGSPLSAEMLGVLRQFAGALTKATMYPAGHKLARDTAAEFTEHLALVLEKQGALTIGFTPRTMVIGGTMVEPIPGALREFAQKLHRRNVGVIHFVPGVTVDEVAPMLSALAAADAEEQVGREGFRSAHIRVEPLTYDVLAFGDGGIEEDLYEVFWTRLVEAAFGRRLADGEAAPTSAQLAAAISTRATESAEGAGRVYEALAAFSSALSARADRNIGSARRRFIEVLSALSRPVTTRIMKAAPTAVSRRRFMRETLEQVPPILLLQLLESVAEADDAPISTHLRWLLGKLANGEGTQAAAADGIFATEVMGLIEQWDGVIEAYDPDGDVRLVVEPIRVLATGLELGIDGGPVVAAARVMAGSGRLAEVLQMLDHPANDRRAAEAVRRALIDPGLLARLLGEPSPDWSLVTRISKHAGLSAVDPLLDALDRAESRAVRRRLIDMIAAVGREAEPRLVARLEGAEWHLARNILTILAQLEHLDRIDEVTPLLRHADNRVRFEALKVLLRDPAHRDRTITEALEGGDPAMARIALAAIGNECPPNLIAPILASFAIADDEVILQAIRLVADSDNPLVVSPLLALIREKGGFFRRWRLRPVSPESLAALEVLLRRWRGHRQVVVAEQLVRRSSDPRIRRLLEEAQ